MTITHKLAVTIEAPSQASLDEAIEALARVACDVANSIVVLSVCNHAGIPAIFHNGVDGDDAEDEGVHICITDAE